ncbi:hypothetical protein B0H19DRAFT_1142968 [Mycena capillaripes]|nr:hypothetical protein B0H19DRAFT_1142968 [Mycena capillaripes]
MPEKSPVNLTHLLKSNDVPLDSEIPFIRDIVREGQDQVDELGAQIDNLDAAIARLVQKRDEIAEQVRKHRAVLSPIRHVPPELVCEILALSVFSDDDDAANSPPWHLGHICQSWRHSVLGNPSLWNSVTIPSVFSFGQGSPFLPMIENQLIRSATAPLNVYWAAFGDGCRPDPGSVDSILAQCGRWRALRLNIYTPVDLNWLLPADRRLPVLEQLEVIICDVGVEVLDIFSAAPSLRKVFLDNWQFRSSPPDIAVPWEQITHYRGTIRSDSHVYILKVAPNLVHCAICFTWTAHVTPPGGSPALLPCLRRLVIENPRFLPRLKAPLLQELFCIQHDTTDLVAILPFVHRSLCSLKKLVLTNCAVNSQLIDVLRGLPGLTYLLIEVDGTEGFEDAEIAFFNAMMISEPSRDLCPNLSYFAYGSEFNFPRKLFFDMA